MMIRALVFALALVPVGLGAASADLVPLRDSVPHVTATGSAHADVVPDQADLKLGVSFERPEAESATQSVADAATAIIADLKARGVYPKDIHTNFELEAKYDSVTDPIGHSTTRRLRGYVASEEIAVRVRDMAKAGPLARALIDKGANQFRGMSFSYSQEKQRRRELAADAMRDALAAARTYTDAIGLKLGRALQIGDDESRGGQADLPVRRAPPVYVPPPINAQTSIPIPTEPSVIRLFESVTVIWEIEGKAP